MYAAWRDAGRWLLTSGAFFLPQPRRKAIDRWLRGREEHRKLQLADYVLMSWGKSGRTWLRVMLSRFYQIAYGIPEGRMLEFDNLKRANPAIPSVFFTHGNYLRNYTGNWTDKSEFYGKKIVMLVRDPRDIAVSQYFQWKYRMRPIKKMLNDYPAHGAEVPIFDFLMNPRGRPARDHRLPRDVAARAAAGAGFDRGPLRGHAGRPRGGAAARAGVPRHARRPMARSGTRSPMPPTTT